VKKRIWCGIDVSARELVVALDSGTGKVWEGVLANDAAGHRQLVRRLR